MMPEQFLRPEPIYRVNAELERLDIDFSKYGVSLYCAQLDPKLRAWRWLSIHSENWDLDLNPTLKGKAHDIVENLVAAIENEQKRDHDRSAAEGSIGDRQSEELITPNLRDRLQRFLSNTSKRPQDFHHDLLTLVTNRTVPASLFSDGLVYRYNTEAVAGNLKENNERLIDNEDKWHQPAVWFDVTPEDNVTRPKGLLEPRLNWTAHIGAGSDKVTIGPHWFNQSTGKFSFEDEHNINEDEKNRESNESAEKTKSIEELLVDLSSLFLNQDEGIPGKVLIFPLYDGYMANMGYGRLLGNIHLIKPRRQDEAASEDDALAAHAKEILLPNLARLVSALKSAAIAEIASDPVTNDDLEARLPLVRHFLRTIAFIQDWERITAFRNVSGRPEAFETWERQYENGQTRWVQAAHPDDTDTNRLKNGKSDDRVLVSPFDLLDMVYPSWLSQTERQELEGFRFVFHYPDYALLPADPSQRKKLERSYIVEQNEIWRLLYPKVIFTSRSRRDAIRQAAASLISRNLSHNIGSHVLASLSVRQTLRSACIGSSPSFDAVSQAISHVRERMDFIAEVVTQDPSWTLPAGLRRIVDDFKKQDVVLKNLTERTCEVTFEQPQLSPNRLMSDRVALPHGQIGAQALFAILENVLRNSVRHGSKTAERGKLIVTNEAPSTDGPIPHHVVPLLIQDLGTPHSEMVDQKLRSAVAAPFMKLELGVEALDRSSWGIKEMRICAAFLRRRQPYAAAYFLDHQGTEGYEGTLEKPWIDVQWKKNLKGDSHDSTKFLTYELLMLASRTAAYAGPSPDDASWLPASGILSFKRIENLLESARSAPLGLSFLVIHHTSLKSFLANIDDNAWKARFPVRLICVGNDNDDSFDPRIAHVIESDWMKTLAECADRREPALMQRLLYHTWNDHLARLAGLEKVPRLVLACDTRLNSADDVRLLNDRTIVCKDGIFSDNDLPDLPAGPDERLVIYERHGDKDFLHDRGNDRLWQQVQSYTAYSGGDEAKHLIESAAADDTEEQPVAAAQLLESSLVWIFVIDERLSVWAKEQHGTKKDEVQLDELWRSGIYLHEFPDEQSIEEEDLDPEKIRDKVIEAAGNGRSGAFGFRPRQGLLFVTIHHGIMKTVFGDDMVRARDWIRQVCGDLNGGRDKGPLVEVFIHSGRGVPPELLEGPLSDTKFLEYSNLFDLVRIPALKTRLVHLFAAVRR